MDDTYTSLSLQMDPATKAIFSPDAALVSELALLNSTHRALLALDTPHTPPPPLPINPKRSAAIQKMREQGNIALNRRHHTGPSTTSSSHATSTASSSNTAAHDAQTLYTYAIDMALTRPLWEPASLTRDELAPLLSNRAQTRLALRAWPEAAADARASVALKPAPGQGKAWWRGGRCLVEMGKLEEAREWVLRALEVEGNGEAGAELRALAKEVGVGEGKTE